MCTKRAINNCLDLGASNSNQLQCLRKINMRAPVFNNIAIRSVFMHINIMYQRIVLRFKFLSIILLKML